MRRRVAAAVALGTALALSVLGSSVASSPRSAVPAPPSGQSARLEATRALRAADRVLSGRGPHADASMALLRLRLTMHSLSPAGRRRAAMILARPTDHPDPYNEAYTVK